MVRRFLRDTLRVGLNQVLDRLDRRAALDDLNVRVDLDTLRDRMEIVWRELDLDQPDPDPTIESIDGEDIDTDIGRPVQPLQPPHPLTWTVAQALRPAYGHDYPTIGVAFQEISITVCPACGARINALTSWGDPFQPEMPAVCVCGVCAHPFRFSGDDAGYYDLIALTPEEIEGLDTETRQMVDAARMMLNQ